MPSKKQIIRFISADEVLPIRNEVLRGGKTSFEACRFDNDELKSSFHLGYFVNTELAGVASFHNQSLINFNGKGYQLRGMATAEKYRRKGFGNQLLNFAMVYLRGQMVDYLWCNARKTALIFYLNAGFEIISLEFDIPGIGAHHKMYVKLR